MPRLTPRKLLRIFGDRGDTAHDGLDDDCDGDEVELDDAAEEEPDEDKVANLRHALRELGFTEDTMEVAMQDLPPDSDIHSLVDWILDWEVASHSSCDVARAAKGSHVLPSWLRQVVARPSPKNPKHLFLPACNLVTAKYSYLPASDAMVHDFAASWGWRCAGAYGPRAQAQAMVFSSDEGSQREYYIGLTPALTGAWTVGLSASRRVMHFPAVELGELLRREPKMTKDNRFANEVAGCGVHKDVMAQCEQILECGLDKVFESAAAMNATIYLLGYSYGAPKAQLLALYFKLFHADSNAQIRVMTWGGLRWMNARTKSLYQVLLEDDTVQFVAHRGGDGWSMADPVCGWPSQTRGFASVHNEYLIDNTGEVTIPGDNYDNDYIHSVTSKTGFQQNFFLLHFGYTASAKALANSLAEPSGTPARSTSLDETTNDEAGTSC